MKTITLDDLNIYWGLAKADDEFVLYGTMFRKDLPERPVAEGIATCEIHIPVALAKEENTTMGQMIELGRERLALDLQEVSGTGMFKNDEPSDWVLDMRRLFKLEDA